MIYVHGILLAGFCLWAIFLMSKYDNGPFHFVGTLGVFSLGYYVLPVFFQEKSGLDKLDANRLVYTVIMFLVFFAAILIGNIIAHVTARRPEVFSMTMPWLDQQFMRHRKYLFFAGYVLWIGGFLKGPSTSYASENFDAFFLEQDATAGMLGALSGYALGIMAFVLASLLRERDRLGYLMIPLYLSCVVLQLSTAQRLSVITPIFTLVAALSVVGAGKVGNRLLVGGIGLLVLVSPLMVFLREFSSPSGGGTEKISAAASVFSFGGGVFDELLTSIMQRADLLEVSTYLMDYVDAAGYVNGQYYLSVLLSLVPRVIIGNKPYVLSDDGTMYGSLSVIAWGLLQGSAVGSLSAFGAISAYWEGGWAWLPINGLLTGALYAVIYWVFGMGGPVARVIYCTMFVSACVKNVPPSFFELIAYIGIFVTVAFALWFADRLLQSYFSRRV